MNHTTVIAFGGNALSAPQDRGGFSLQLQRARDAVRQLVRRIADGERMLFVHGNGPQVGHELMRSEACSELAPVPMDACVASTQGTIGYALELAMRTELQRAHVRVPVSSLVTLVRVDRDDPAMSRPDKPVGPFYSAEHAARLSSERGWSFAPCGARGHRRLVPSPRPIEVHALPAIRMLLDAGHVVIAGGGGGIAVDHLLAPVEAVVDKDYTAALLGLRVGARRLIDLTDVDWVYQRFGTSDAAALSRMSVAEARASAEEGHFAAGSMAPKIDAACLFLEGGGSEVIITSFHRLQSALEGHCGTLIKSGAAAIPSVRTGEIDGVAVRSGVGRPELRR